MINFVDSVADLTSLRDREELEIIMALAAADLLGASGGKLWRLAGRPGDLRLFERAGFADGRVTVSEAPSEWIDLPILDSRPDLRRCFELQRSEPLTAYENGQHRHVFPVRNSFGIVGMLEIFSAEPLREDQDRLVAGLLRIYQNHLKLLDYSESDELTGLLNRKTFDTAFALLTRIESPPRARLEQFERIERRRPANPNQQRWLAVLDIDFFKSINDRFGHPVGDDVLTALARLMRDSFRESDRLFRCGGEEFIVLLEPTEAEHVAGILERFRLAVETNDFPKVGQVTLSIGYTGIAPDDDGWKAFRRADEALYAAKRRGRNQVIAYEGLAGLEAPPTAQSQVEAPAARL
jgi:diguanylate cyclase (GGDEF)-like protein